MTQDQSQYVFFLQATITAEKFNKFKDLIAGFKEDDKSDKIPNEGKGKRKRGLTNTESEDDIGGHKSE